MAQKVLKRKSTDEQVYVRKRTSLRHPAFVSRKPKKTPTDRFPAREAIVEVPASTMSEPAKSYTLKCSANRDAGSLVFSSNFPPSVLGEVHVDVWLPSTIDATADDELDTYGLPRAPDVTVSLSRSSHTHPSQTEAVVLVQELTS